MGTSMTAMLVDAPELGGDPGVTATIGRDEIEEALAADEPLDLILDVARPAEILLDIDGVVVKGSLGLGPRQREGFRCRFRALHNLHAASAAAGHGLDQHRPADLFAKGDDLFQRLDRPGRPRH